MALQKNGVVLALFQGQPVPEATVLEIGISMAAGEIVAQLLEPFVLVWIRPAVAQGLGHNFAFRLVKR